MLTDLERLQMLEEPRGTIDVIIDSDTYNEVDDQFAIAYALGLPQLNILGLCAAPFFNERSSGPADGMERSYQEIQRLLSLTRQTAVPVLRGSAEYLPDEQTAVPSAAAAFIVKKAMAYSKDRPLYVVGLGAITNIASALLLEPRIADRMVIVWLGGHALEWPHTREFNLNQDVAAARVVFGSGAPLVMLPCMGVVSHFTVSGPELEYWLRGENPLCDYLTDTVEQAAEAYAAGKPWTRVIWDVTAIAWLVNQGHRFMDDRLIPAPIPAYDHHWSSDPTRPLCRYVYCIHRDALMDHLFQSLIVRE